MKGFIVDLNYKIIDSKPCVLLYGRLSNGQSFLSISSFEAYFYIKKNDLKKAEKTKEKFRSEKSDFKNSDEEEVVKILVSVPADVPKLRKSFEKKDIVCYEADIRFPYRFLVDNDIKGSIDIEGDYEMNDRIDRIYKNPDIKSSDYFPSLKVAAFDIETDAEGKKIRCISLVCGDYKKVFVDSKKKLKRAISCKNEEEVLTQFRENLLELDPDVVSGWNVIDFDFVVLKERFQECKIPFDFGRVPATTKLKIEDHFMRSSKVDMEGRQVLDGMNLLKGSFIKLPDYRLNTAAKHFLGKEKLITSHDRWQEIEELYHSNQQKLVDYNLLDSELVVDIIEKSKTLNLSIRRSLLTGMPLDRVSASIASFDSVYLREARKRKIVIPSGSFGNKEKPGTGGYVMESKPGIYDYILVLDFKSLYPSIVRTFNIDPLSYSPSQKGKNLLKAPNNAHFKNDEESILSVIIQDLWEEREKARKNNDELTRYAIKILMNSFYGALASPACRFFNLNVSNAITHFSHFLIKETAFFVEKKRYHVIYSDTDSIFVQSQAKNQIEAEKIGKKLEWSINEHHKKRIKEEYNRKSILEIEFEKCYIKFLMPSLRGKETGAKKRYAGLLKKEGKEKIDVVGLESIRGDWTDLAHEFQKELLDRIFHEKAVEQYVQDFIKDVRSGKKDSLLVYRKSLRKNLEDYAVNTAHKKAAMKLLKRGGQVSSNLIEYVMTKDGPEPVGYVREKIDYEHYIEKQIMPLLQQVLPFLKLRIEDVLHPEQKRLDYF